MLIKKYINGKQMKLLRLNSFDKRYCIKGCGRLSHLIWNHYNPNNLWRNGYVVHHKDKNTLNDHISNLELLTVGEHTKLHMVGTKYNLGRKASTETKTKMSNNRKGEGNYFYGKHHSIEVKKKLSELNSGYTHSEVAKKKMSESRKGQKFTEEHKRKISEALKGRFFTEEHRKNISESQKGKIISEEQKQKLSKAIVGRTFSEETKRRMSESAKKAKRRIME